MRKQIRIVAAALCAGLLLGAVTTTNAASIGVNFIGRGKNSSSTSGFDLAPAAFAGVVPQSSWNNVDSGQSTFDGATGSLLDNSGAFTAVKLTYEANDSWSSDGPTATDNDILMKGTIKLATTNTTDRLILTITNLPAGTFNVLVYFANDGTGSLADADVGGATTYFLALENVFSGTFTRALATTAGTAVTANYAQFDAVPSVNGAITISARKTGPGNTSIGITGVQIVNFSGTSFPPNTDACSITTPPQNTDVALGNTATFSVVTAGPVSNIQWQKNGVNIPGATSSSYTTPATVLADSGTTYRVSVWNNVNTNTSANAILTVFPPVLTQGFMTVQRWDNAPGATVDDALVTIAAGPPTVTYFVAGANQPDAGVDNFASTMSGWIKPTVTGDYDFFLRSDDLSRLYLNEVAVGGSGTNALPNPQTATPIAEVTTCCQAFAEPGTGFQTTVNPIHLEAGKLYGMVAVLQEITGGDYVQVAWRLTTDTTPAAQLKPIAPGSTYTMASGAGQTAVITTQPASVTNFEAQSVTFKVAATTTPTAGLFGVQWLKNGVEIAGANGLVYQINGITLAQSGSVFKARLYTLTGVVDSSPATLTVLPDTNPPVAAVGAITTVGGAIQIGVSFDESVNPAGLIAGNFTLNGGTATFSLAQNSLGTYAGVLLTNVTGLVPGGSYTVTVKNVADLKGNAITSTNVPFTVGQVRWADTGVPPRPSQVVPVGGNGFDVLNGGRTEWGTYDEVALVYVPKTNDFDVKLQVIWAEPSSQWGRVGLQARNALDAGVASDVPDGGASTTFSAYAQTHVNPNQTLGSSGVWPASDPVQPGNPTPNNGHEQNTRLDTGIATSGWGTTATSPVYPNVWLRLQRTADVIRGFRSEDGVTWVDQGTVTLTAQTNVMLIGPSLSAETGNIWTSGFNVWTSPFDPTYARLFLAQYRNFGDVTVPVPPSSITVGRSGANVVLTWTAGALQSSGTANGTYTDVAGATSPYTTPATGTQKYYRLRGTE